LGGRNEDYALKNEVMVKVEVKIRSKKQENQQNST